MPRLDEKWGSKERWLQALYLRSSIMWLFRQEIVELELGQLRWLDAILSDAYLHADTLAGRFATDEEAFERCVQLLRNNIELWIRRVGARLSPMPGSPPGWTGPNYCLCCVSDSRSILGAEMQRQVCSDAGVCDICRTRSRLAPRSSQPMAGGVATPRRTSTSRQNLSNDGADFRACCMSKTDASAAWSAVGE